jgi:CheY-like chemotaxis protein
VADRLGSEEVVDGVQEVAEGEGFGEVGGGAGGQESVAERIFSRNGYHVITAANGPEAVTVGYDGDIHLLVTDVLMAKMLGKEVVAQRIPEIRPDVEVLYMSGYAQPVVACVDMAKASHDGTGEAGTTSNIALACGVRNSVFREHPQAGAGTRIARWIMRV